MHEIPLGYWPAVDNPNMICLIKVDRKAKYSHSVRMIDELNIASITRFSLAPLLDADKKIIGLPPEPQG